MVDTSTPVASHIVRLQEDLKLLIQQQLPMVDSFNIARCVSDYSLTTTVFTVVVVLTVIVSHGGMNWLNHHLIL